MSTVFFVKGNRKATLCNTLNNEIFLLDENEVEILESIIDKPVRTDLKKNEKEFIELLNKEEYIFETEEIEKFPKIDISKYHHAGEIENSIIEYDKFSKHYIMPIISLLSDYGCKYFFLKYYDIIDKNELINLFDTLKANYNGELIDLLIQKSDQVDEEFCIQLVEEYNFLNSITVSGAPFTEFLVLNDATTKGGMGSVFFTEQKIDNANQCGFINPKLFNANIKTVIKNASYNSCLYKKVSIDRNGKLKSCPTLKNQYGIFSEQNLQKMLVDENFIKLQNINKDKIKVCSGCEFRLICSDCRAHHEIDLNYEKPKHCNYVP